MQTSKLGPIEVAVGDQVVVLADWNGRRGGHHEVKEIGRKYITIVSAEAPLRTRRFDRTTRQEVGALAGCHLLTLAEKAKYDRYSRVVQRLQRIFRAPNWYALFDVADLERIAAIVCGEETSNE